MEATVTITIEYDQLTGTVKLNGPTQPLLCFGMLELAKQGFQKHFSEVSANQKIITPQFGMRPQA